MRTREAWHAWWKSALAAVVLAGSVLAATWRIVPVTASDSEYYIAMARGHGDQAIQPFARRVLHPSLVRTLTLVTGKSVDWAFVTVAVAALLVFAGSLTAFARKAGLNAAVVPLLVFSPLLLRMFSHAYLPDLLHAALLALLFALQPSGFLVTAVMACLLQTTRENTLLLAVCACAVGVAKKRLRLATGFALGTLSGVALGSIFSFSSPGNIHGLSGFPYLVLKVPFNLLRNVLGIPLWTNTLDYCQPWATWHVPGWLPHGAVQLIGICPVDHGMQRETVVALLTTFGVASAVVAWALLRGGLASVRALEPWMQVALVYGLVSLAAGVCTGNSVNRLVGYGWPAFWVAGAVYLNQLVATHWRLSLSLLLNHTLILWSPYVCFHLARGARWASWVAAACAGILLVAVLWQLRSQQPRPGQCEPPPAVGNCV